jgi:hypothetical protein
MAAQDTMQYLTMPDYATNANLAAQQNMRIETLTRIQRTLVTERPRTMRGLRRMGQVGVRAVCCVFDCPVESCW